MQFPHVMSTAPNKVHAVPANAEEKRAEASAADVEVNNVVLRQRSAHPAFSKVIKSPAVQQDLEKLLSVWLMKPFGCGRKKVGVSLPMSALIEPKRAANIRIIFM